MTGQQQPVRTAGRPGRRRGLRRGPPAAEGLLHRHLGLHRLQGVRGGLQGVERRPRRRLRPARHVLRQHRRARREHLAARRVHRAAAAAGRARTAGCRPGRRTGSGDGRRAAAARRGRGGATWARARCPPRRRRGAGRRRRSDLGMPAFEPPGDGHGAEGRTTFRWLMSSDVCKHCTHAACLDVCPTGALFRTEFGTVVVQDDICNGCGYCVSGCPYGVIDRRKDDGRAWKCTLCYDRLDDGHDAGLRAGLPDRVDPVRRRSTSCASGPPRGSTQLHERGRHRGPALRRTTRTTASAATARSSCCSTSPRSTACRRTRSCPPATCRGCGARRPRPRPAAFAVAGSAAFVSRGGRGTERADRRRRPRAGRAGRARRRGVPRRGRRRRCSRASRAGGRRRARRRAAPRRSAATGAAASRRWCREAEFTLLLRPAGPQAAGVEGRHRRRTCSSAAWPPARRCSRAGADLTGRPALRRGGRLGALGGAGRQRVLPGRTTSAGPSGSSTCCGWPSRPRRCRSAPGSSPRSGPAVGAAALQRAGAAAAGGARWPARLLAPAGPPAGLVGRGDRARPSRRTPRCCSPTPPCRPGTRRTTSCRSSSPARAAASGGGLGMLAAPRRRDRPGRAVRRGRRGAELVASRRDGAPDGPGPRGATSTARPRRLGRAAEVLTVGRRCSARVLLGRPQPRGRRRVRGWPCSRAAPCSGSGVLRRGRRVDQGPEVRRGPPARASRRPHAVTGDGRSLRRERRPPPAPPRAMSIFFMPSIAWIARCARPGSGSPISSFSRVGTTCHDTPNRSLSHPHGPSSPPSDSRDQ